MAGKSKNYRDQVQEAVRGFDFVHKRYQLTLETSLGDITLDMWPEVAPGHVGNMLGLAKAGFYDGLTFHRVVPGFVIQGGCPSGSGTGGPGYQIDAEFNDRAHDPGVLSMARSQDPNSAGSQFFLCLEKAAFLDRNYTAFGKTTDAKSLDVVRAIGKVKTGSGDRPVDAVTIKAARVAEVSPA